MAVFIGATKKVKKPKGKVDMWKQRMIYKGEDDIYDLRGEGHSKAELNQYIDDVSAYLKKITSRYKK